MTALVRAVIAIVVGALVGTTPAPAHATHIAHTRAVTSVPRPAHVLVVVMENHSYGQIIGTSAAPYINSLARTGALFTASHAVSHPSEPNYLALFSGSTHGLTSDQCPVTFTGANLGAALIAKHLTFKGFSENMPSDGYQGCGGTTGYARKHNPWVDYTNVPTASNLTYGRFPSSYGSLPTVSFVIPNLCHDMHDCSVTTGDSWLRSHINGYAVWARTHNSVLVLTFDEAGRGTPSNQIATIIVGQSVKPGRYAMSITHYNVLRTIEDMYGLPRAGASSSAAPITAVWR
jgi:hypothetical protein